ncbi:MAG: L-aspartate oxidase [Planctomycetes bacterium]|nr:L-aspartate oxidase [Planctomycetota bacterium]
MNALHAVPRFPGNLAAFDLRTTALLRTDVLVIGSGIAGACAALHAAEAGADVLLLAKGDILDTNTACAQGGIAVVRHAEDSIAAHIADTLRVGAGIADPEVARSVIPGADDAVSWLEQLGTRFDQRAGDLELSREGGHSHARVAHANGDATGQEIQRALEQALRHPRLTVRPQTFVRDLIVRDGRCIGAIANHGDLDLAVEAGAVIVATGGTGQIYRETTNPTGASGDGHALCFRAGARMVDCEFVQFHPTTLYIAGASRFLISEIVRGAGAVLRDRNGDRFMQQAHPMAELAPRDVVSRAILERMVATDDTHVYLDLRAVAGDARAMFPSIARICATFDLDLAVDPIPVRPGAHYYLGGAATDLDGRTNVEGLFAVGEAASSGLHGANRLASNSLLEGAVLGRRTGLAAAEAAGRPHLELPRRVAGAPVADSPPRLLHDDLLYSLKSMMWRQVGLIRDARGLAEALNRIGFWNHYLVRAPLVDQRTFELANMLTVAGLAATAALHRDESRGTHYRSDHTERRDLEFCRRIYLDRAENGQIRCVPGDITPASDLQLT